MIKIVVWLLLKVVRKRSRFVVLVEISDSEKGAEYLFTSRGYVFPDEIENTLGIVSSQICEDVEVREVDRFLKECSK